MTLRVIINAELPSQNVRERQHWAVRRKMEKRWEHSIRWQISLDDMAQSRRRRVRVTSYRARLITDSANLVGGAKGLVDAVVRAGLLVDDSDQWAHIEYAQGLRSHPDNPCPGKSCTVVEITEAEALTGLARVHAEVDHWLGKRAANAGRVVRK